jgi:hypothetical protein
MHLWENGIFNMEKKVISLTIQTSKNKKCVQHKGKQNRGNQSILATPDTVQIILV